MRLCRCGDLSIYIIIIIYLFIFSISLLLENTFLLDATLNKDRYFKTYYKEILL